jgi:acetoin utilization deacetylase AcuC-like enzyme
MFGILMNPIFKEHDTGAHPERAERLGAIEAGIEDLPLELALKSLQPVVATRETVALAHEPAYIDWVKAQIESGVTGLDADTAVCPRSYDVAMQAVGGSVAGLEAIMKGELTGAFFGVRPPGHHAERDRSKGFCLFNNIAIAARHLIVNHGLERVAIYDFDVHHGNGTMHTFYEDPSVFYGSVHQWPWYPGTGQREERGQGKGRGTTLNSPYPHGAGDDEYEEATNEFASAMEKFKPEFLLISAGFDAHWSDQLSGHQVTERGYVTIAETLREIAADHCGGRVAMFLEGGYNLSALRNCVPACIRTLAG